MVTAPRLWPGETVVCMATGPSLTQADVDRCRGLRMIVVNDAHRMAPWADVLYSSDRYWYPHYQGVPTFAGMKFGIGTSPLKANPFHRYPEIRVLKNTGYEGLETDPSGLRNGKNSGYAAINLAVHLGAARVILLGYDMGFRRGLAHFFGNHPPQLNQTERNYPTFRRLFATLPEPLRAAGVEVINCTPGSALECFPMGTLAETLAREPVTC